MFWNKLNFDNKLFFKYKTNIFKRQKKLNYIKLGKNKLQIQNSLSTPDLNLQNMKL